MKNKNYSIIIIGITYVLLMLTMFMLTPEYTQAFYIGAVFTTAAFGLCIFISNKYNSLHEDSTAFLNINYYILISVYLVVQAVVYAYFTFKSIESATIPVVIYSILLGVVIIFILLNRQGQDIIQATDKGVAANYNYIQHNVTALNRFIRNNKDSALDKDLDRLLDKLKYSDPMSQSELASIEDNIQIRISQLSKIESSLIVSEVKEISELLDERNSYIKTNK